MKKLSGILAIVLLGIILVGCEQPAKEKNKQADQPVVQLKETDERLLVAKGLVDEIEVFEYQLPKDTGTLNLWKDIYEDGVKVETSLAFGDYEPDEKGMITFGALISTSEDSEEKEEEEATPINMTTIISTVSENSVMKMTGNIETYTRFVQANQDLKPDKQGTYPLYLEHYFENESEMYASLPAEFLYQPDDYLADLGEGETVYVYRLEFK